MCFVDDSTKFNIRRGNFYLSTLIGMQQNMKNEKQNEP